MAQGISTTLRLVDQMTAPIMSINNAINNLITGFNKVENASDINTSSLDAMHRQVDMANFAAEQLNQQFQLVEDTIEQMEQGQKEFNNTIRQGHGAMDSLAKKIIGAVAAYASIQGVKKVMDISDTLTQTTARLNMMNDGLQSTEELQNMIFSAAERSRGSYQATADSVSKIGIMARDAFSSNRELIAFAEQLNKQFTIAGTSSQGVEAAMLQLTQAMGSGVLRGEELNSVFEQAPTIIQTIADYLDVPIGKIREMAKDGQLTAGVVKSALLSAADETNAKFEAMPKTFGQVAASIKNQALMAFQPVLNRLNEIANSPSFDTLVSNVTSALVVVAGVVLSIFEAISAVAQFAADNWSWLAPIIWTVVAAMAAYAVILAAYNIAQGVSNGLKAAAAMLEGVHAAKIALSTGATFAQTAAQYGLNAALLACPLTWILIAIIAVIGAIYIVIGVVNQAAGASVSATGVIFGAFAALGAFLWNLFLGLLDLILGVIQHLVNPFIQFANFLGNLFINPVASIIYLFQGLADNVLAILESIANAIDSVFGSNLAGAVSGWRSGLKGAADSLVQKLVPDKEYKELVPQLNLGVEKLGLNRIAYGDAYNGGYGAGENFENGIKDLFSGLTNPPSTPSLGGVPPIGNNEDYGPSGLSDIGTGVGNIDGNTKKTADISEEELKLWRDIAERDTINRFTTAEVKVDFGGIHNNVSSDMDLDGITDYIGGCLEETLLEVAEGVHA